MDTRALQSHPRQCQPRACLIQPKSKGAQDIVETGGLEIREGFLEESGSVGP